MTSIQFVGALELGLVYSLIALGVFLSFRVLNFADLSGDGTFPLGAAISAVYIIKGGNPALSLVWVFLVGGFAGIVTAYLSTHLKMMSLLAGILTMTALYSLNLRIMGRPNIALLGERTIFDGVESMQFGRLIFLIVLVVIVVGMVWYLLSTKWGFGLRAVGSNPRMSRAQGISDTHMIRSGLFLSNGLIAVSGGLYAQLFGVADATMGVGTVVMGLAAVIIGEAFFSRFKMGLALFGCVLGSLIYRLLVAFALNLGGGSGEFGLQASDLNFVTAMLMVFAIIIPQVRQRLVFKSSVKGK